MNKENIERNYTEEIIKSKIKEYNQSAERLNKYWKVLMKKGVRIAQERGLETIVTTKKVHLIKDITVYKKGEEVSAEQIISLVKEIWPGIYQTYKERRERHKELEDELKKIRNDLIN